MDAAETGKEFGRIGRRLFTAGLLSANFGNMSVRSGEGFYITRTGSFLDVPEEPVYVPLEGPVPGDASSEYRVHREIYRITSHRAVVHAHPPHAIALSFSTCPYYPGRYGRRHVLPVNTRYRGKAWQ